MDAQPITNISPIKIALTANAIGVNPKRLAGEEREVVVTGENIIHIVSKWTGAHFPEEVSSGIAYRIHI